MSARHQSSTGYLAAHAALYGPRARKSRYQRELLPEPQEYYRRHLHALRITGHQARARCPFHEDRNPSLSVNLVDGRFNCFGCGAKGGDVLDFHRRFHDMGFVAAAKDLGAWEVDR
jgi:hypothetical protein